MKIEISNQEGFTHFRLVFPDETVEEFPMTHANSLVLYEKLGQYLKTSFLTVGKVICHQCYEELNTDYSDNSKTLVVAFCEKCTTEGRQQKTRIQEILKSD